MPRTQEILFGVGIFVGLLGACLLIAFGVQYLKPYLQVRTMEEATCTVSLGVENLKEIHTVTCQCSRDSKSQCLSHYPCITILVNVTATKSDTMLHNVTLYDSFETFRLMQKTDLDVSILR